MARTYGYALAGALIATFTVTPVLASFLLPQRVQEAETHRGSRAAPRVHAGAPLRARPPSQSWSSLGVAFVAIAALLLPRLGSEFLPQLEEGNYWIRVQLPPSTGLVSGTPATGKLREILLRHPEVLAAGSQQRPGPASQSDVADRANGGAVKDGSGLTDTHRGNTDEAPAKTDTTPKTAPAATRGLQRATTPAPGIDAKPSEAGVPIDTRITVNQGREIIKGKDRRFNKIKTAAAPGIGLKHEPVHNLRQGSSVETEAGPRRNAIGAVVEHGKTVANRSGTVGAALSTNVALQRASAMLHEPANKISSGNTSVKTQSAGTTELGNHASPAPAVLRVASSNGLGMSGTGIIRPGLGVGALGGPAKNGAPGLSGSNFRPRRP